jgi:hypothetical protein
MKKVTYALMLLSMGIMQAQDRGMTTAQELRRAIRSAAEQNKNFNWDFDYFSTEDRKKVDEFYDKAEQLEQLTSQLRKIAPIPMVEEFQSNDGVGLAHGIVIVALGEVPLDGTAHWSTPGTYENFFDGIKSRSELIKKVKEWAQKPEFDGLIQSVNSLYNYYTGENLINLASSSLQELAAQTIKRHEIDTSEVPEIIKGQFDL